MRVIHLALVFCLLASTLYAQTEYSLKIKPPINALTVFLNGAEINQTETLSLKKGKNKIEICGLSSSIMQNSIQVAIKDAQLISTKTVEQMLDADELPQRIGAIVTAKNKVEKDIQLITDEIDAYKAQKSLLSENRSVASQTGLLLIELKEAMEFHLQNTLKINNKISILETELGIKKEMADSLNDQLKKQHYAESQNRIKIIVEALSDKDCVTVLNFCYLVNNAGWAPSYDIIASDITQPIELIYRAKLYNNTGVDWENVNLTLSTADPTLDANKPSLEPWYLDYSTYQMNKSRAGYLNSAEIAESNIFSGTFNKGADYEVVAIDKLGIEFPIEKTYDIIADAKPYLVDIKQHLINASYSYLAVPKEDKDAFLMASVTDWAELKLIDGPANIYFGDTYVGRSSINTRSVEDSLPISLGRDKEVIVTRTLKKDFGTKKIIGTNRKDEFIYEIIVKNNRNAQIEIEVADQLPISKQSDIIVEINTITDADHNTETGKLSWKTQIQPGGTKVYQLSYSVKYPKNKTVNIKQMRKVNIMTF